jgi:hypothetical protein
MDSGRWIKKKLEERFIKASDLERLSRAIAEEKGNSNFYLSHSTLADIAEKAAIPSIHKIFSLAVCLKLPFEQLLVGFGVDPNEALTYGIPKEVPQTETALGLRAPGFRFQLQFDRRLDPKRTTLLHSDFVQAGTLGVEQMDPQRFRYGLIGLEDTSLGDVIPAGSVVEMDKGQNTIGMFSWKSLRERPIYFIWHSEGYSCCWCQQDRNDLTLVPHPCSPQPIRRFRMPRDANIIGRVINAWLSFQSSDPIIACKVNDLGESSYRTSAHLKY